MKIRFLITTTNITSNLEVRIADLIFFSTAYFITLLGFNQ